MAYSALLIQATAANEVVQEFALHAYVVLVYVSIAEFIELLPHELSSRMRPAQPNIFAS